MLPKQLCVFSFTAIICFSASTDVYKTLTNINCRDCCKLGCFELDTKMLLRFHKKQHQRTFEMDRALHDCLLFLVQNWWQKTVEHKEKSR